MRHAIFQYLTAYNAYNAERRKKMKEIAKYSVLDIARWFLLKEEMSQRKLQALCYYAQAWYYALNGYRLEDTDYQAWVQGPISPVLQERFKSLDPELAGIKESAKLKLDTADERLLEDIWDTYGSSSENALEILAQRELPWLEARRGCRPDEMCTSVISPASMASYYRAIHTRDQ